jgi:hypothetical protein
MINARGRKRKSKPNAWARRIIALQERLGLDDAGLAERLNTLLPGYEVAARGVQGWRLNEREPSGAWPILIAKLEAK